MKSIQKSIFILSCAMALLLANSSLANAARIGTACKKINAKSWDGETPIVCKKNSRGKLVWSKFFSSASKKTDNSSLSSSKPSDITNSETLDPPKVLQVVSGVDWAAIEIQNSSNISNLIFPGFEVTLLTAGGREILPAIPMVFPMLAPNAKQWIDIPYASTLGELAGGTPARAIIRKSSLLFKPRPTSQSEWPLISNVQISQDKLITFDLTNRSRTLTLDASLFSYFCFNEMGVLTFAGQSKSYVRLTPEGNTQVKGITKLSANQCKSVAVSVNAVYP